MKNWRVITDISDIRPRSKYQEKMIVIAEGKEAANRMRKIVEQEGGEFCEVPKQTLSKFPLAFAFWANKTSACTSIDDIREGNIRMLIEEK